MMVPAPRLLAWTALVGIPAAGLAGLAPERAGPAAAVLLLLAAVAAADALRSRRRLEALRVSSPGPVRLFRARAGLLPLDFDRGDRPVPSLRVGLPFPDGVESPDEVREVAWPGDAPRARLAWPCTVRRRGVYRIESCGVACNSALGLWEVRRRRPLDLEIRVYPDVLAERRHAPALFARRGAFGVRPERRRGKGREFEQLREYLPGDGHEDIHWKATARRGRPVTKVFQVERTQEVYVVVDASRLSGRACGEDPSDTVLERCLTAALLLGRAAERQGDLFGAMAFSDRVLRFVRAGKGRAHTRACLDAFGRLQPGEGSPDFNEACVFLRTRLRRRALLVFLTQLDDPLLAERFLRDIALLRAQHVVLVHMPAPPDVRAPFADPSDVGTPADLPRRLGGHLRWQGLQALRLQLRRQGVSFALLERDRLAVELVSRYMRVKERQRL